jgi:hypothetical protein
MVCWRENSFKLIAGASILCGSVYVCKYTIDNIINKKDNLSYPPTVFLNMYIFTHSSIFLLRSLDVFIASVSDIIKIKSP